MSSHKNLSGNFPRGESDLDDLYRELGEAVSESTGSSQVKSFMRSESVSSENISLPSEWIDVGKAYFEHINVQAWQVVCGPVDEKTDPGVVAFRNAINAGKQAAETALAAVLVAELKLPNKAAQIVGTIVVKLFFDAAYNTGCDLWKKTLPS